MSGGGESTAAPVAQPAPAPIPSYSTNVGAGTATPSNLSGLSPQQQLLAQAMGQTAYFDPRTGMPTNPLFNQAVGRVLQAQQLPSQFGEAQKAYEAGLLATAGQYGYRPESWTTPGTSQQYMNPYIQNVLQNQLQIQNQQNAIQDAALRSQATKSGAYGGARQQLALGQQQFNQNLANQNMVAQALANAYQSGMGQFNTAQQQGLQANQQNLAAAGQMGNLGQGLGALGSQQAQTNLANIGALGTAASSLQNLGQQYLNTQASNAQNMMNYPNTLYAPVMSAINAQPSTGGVQSTTGTQAPGSWLAEGGEVEAPSAWEKAKGEKVERKGIASRKR